MLAVYPWHEMAIRPPAGERKGKGDSDNLTMNMHLMGTLTMRLKIRQLYVEVHTIYFFGFTGIG